MKRIFLFFILLAASLAGTMTSCENPRGTEIFAVAEEMPVANYLQEYPEDFSLWVELLYHADLFHTLNVDALYTCFVPNNDAMQKYLSANGYSSVSSIDKSYAQTLVRYHTIPGKSRKYTSAYFVNGLIPDTTATGDFLSIDYRTEGESSFGVYVNNEAKILWFDTEVTNGVIHTLENVVTPVTESVWGSFRTKNGYSVMAEAIQATGFNTTLDKISEYVETEPSVYITKKYYYTLFAVPDAVFAAKGISSLSGLVTYLGAGNDYTNEDNLLYRYVGYHILDQSMAYDQLTDFQGFDEFDELTRNISNITRKELINLSFVAPNFYLNYDKATQTGTAITEPNLPAKNGLIHIIDGIMPVTTPEAAPVIWELTDYSDVGSAAGSNYRVTTLSSAYTSSSFSASSVTSYTWKTIPADRANAVRYYAAKTDDTPRNSALYKDYLLLQLGTYGWIEMESPLMVKGSYKVSVYHYNPTGTSPSGKLSFIIDGAFVGSEITLNGDSANSTSYKAKEIGTVTFDENTNHTLRIFSGDGSSTYIDYLLFEPVNN